MSPGRMSTVLAQELGHPLYAANLEAVSAQGCFGLEARSYPAIVVVGGVVAVVVVVADVAAVDAAVVAAAFAGCPYSCA